MMRRVLVCAGLAALLTGCGSSSKPVPRGFVPRALSVADGNLWVLGTSALLHSTNGGESFAVFPAPPVRTSGTVPTVLFADARNGFAVQPGLAYATHDARRWQVVASRCCAR